MVRSKKPKRKTNRNDEVPDVFKDMLVDAATSSPARTDDEGRTVKRRRVRGRIVTKVVQDEPEETHQQQNIDTDNDEEMSSMFEDPVSKRPMVIKSESESSDSDIDWEEINLQQSEPHNQDVDPDDDKEGGFNLVLGGDDESSRTPRNIKRKPMTMVEKKLRLEIHKMHICCLLAHIYIRNHWCEDEVVHTILRGVLTKRTISYLNPSEEKSQFQRSRSFMDGLEQASDTFRSRFTITARGISKPYWAETPEALAALQPPKDIDLPMQKSDFISAAQELSASRDVGAQLFCALLRSVGVDARLVCSLQALSFNSSTPATAVPQATYTAYYSAEQEESHSTLGEEGDADDVEEHRSAAKSAMDSHGGRTRFDVNIGDSAEPSPAKLPMHSNRPIRESKYPIYWVESFNEASQKWVPVDPLVTKTIAKPSKFEPPASDRGNSMIYVLAFEDDGSARDVTRRYAKSYNAKTRRDRVESTKGGERWWKRVMRLYRRRYHLDRDQVDDAELAKKEAAEPLPRNVQDFKEHPYYALERHLRRHEAIYPKREVGKVGAGKSGGSTLLESIYRRRDVHIVLSGDKWYRSAGREIKPGEQPLKRVSARRTRGKSIDPENEDEENAGTALYAIHQTIPYTAPTVVNGRIPKNVYGNLDIYVPSMIPPGGSHIQHPEAVRAAKILGIDFAEAVTGFVFKGRHGTAVTRGAVVAEEYREAVLEVVTVFEDERIQAEEELRSREALRMWKRFLAGLRIRERIEGYDIEGERDMVLAVEDTVDEDKEAADDDDVGGGFFPGQEAENLAVPTAGRAFEEQATMNMNEEDGGGSKADHSTSQDENMDRPARDRFLDNLDDDSGKGYLVDDDLDEDGEEALHDAIGIASTSQSPLPRPVPTQEPAETQPSLMLELRDAIDETEGVTPEEAEDRLDARLDRERQSPVDTRLFSVPRIPHFTAELTPEELHEARILQQLYETESKPPTPHNKNQAEASAVRTHEEFLNDTENSSTSDVTSSAPAPDPAIPKPPTDEVEAESPKSDKGSLLTEDPEDEDAEPDWLV